MRKLGIASVALLASCAWSPVEESFPDPPESEERLIEDAGAPERVTPPSSAPPPPPGPLKDWGGGVDDWGRPCLVPPCRSPRAQ